MTKKEPISSTKTNLAKSKKIEEKEPEHSTTEGQWQLSFLYNQFRKESDRAAVILVVSLIDQALMTLIKAKLVPVPTAKDPIFDEVNSAFSTFSSKIDISYRLGIISSKLCRDLHLFRRIRNSFAHDVFDCDFENISVKSRVIELKNSLNCGKKFDEFKHKEDFEGSRGLFLFMSSAILWRLNTAVESIDSLNEAHTEWIYNMI